MDSLLGRLAGRFGAPPEQLAAFALADAAGRCDAVGAALSDLLVGMGARSAGRLSFREEPPGADADPGELTAADPDGADCAVVAATFWSGPAFNQPGKLLRGRVAPGGLLAFIAPARRRETLWATLRERSVADAPFGVEKEFGNWGRSALLPGGRKVAVATWGAVLNALELAALRAGAPATLGDLHQLRGLADRMDDAGFVPFATDELTPPGGRTVLQLCELADQVAARFRRELGAGSWADDGRYFAAPFDWNGATARVCYSPPDWGRLGHPLMLEIRRPMRPGKPPLAVLLAEAAAGDPRRLSERGDAAWLALDVRTRAEQIDVIDDLVRQVEGALRRLADAA